MLDHKLFLATCICFNIQLIYIDFSNYMTLFFLYRMVLHLDKTEEKFFSCKSGYQYLLPFLLSFHFFCQLGKDADVVLVTYYNLIKLNTLFFALTVNVLPNPLNCKRKMPDLDLRYIYTHHSKWWNARKSLGRVHEIEASGASLRTKTKQDMKNACSISCYS